MQQIYRRTPMPKCDLNKTAKQPFIGTTLRHRCSPIYLLHIFRAPFPKNTSRELLLHTESSLFELPCKFIDWLLFDAANWSLRG